MSKRIEKTEVSEIEKKVMREELRDFRKMCSNLSIKERLHGVPFSYTDRLFGGGLFIHNRPCRLLGRQLVLKIVDELLD